MPKLASMSSKKLARLLEKGGAVFVRQGPTDHAIYSRVIEGKRYSAPVQMGKKSLDPIYCKKARLLPKKFIDIISHCLYKLFNAFSI
jgi:predicted RNA binding protein YcfA (HicA-like mRNA interferase family)